MCTHNANQTVSKGIRRDKERKEGGVRRGRSEVEREGEVRRERGSLTSFLKTQRVPATMVREVVTIWNRSGRVTILSVALRGGRFMMSSSTGSTPRLPERSRFILYIHILVI